jgi:hypothetical protein
VDAGQTDGLHTVGFNGGAFDGRFIYFAPWRSGTGENNEIIATGNVLRYDTTGESAGFSLRAVDLGHNGGLTAAVPGPAFLVNTERGVVNVRGNSTLPSGRHHVVGSYDGRRARLFVDGSLAAECSSGGGRVLGEATAVCVGRLEGGLGVLAGRVVHVSIWNAAADGAWVAGRWRERQVGGGQ